MAVHRPAIFVFASVEKANDAVGSSDGDELLVQSRDSSSSWVATGPLYLLACRSRQRRWSRTSRQSRSPSPIKLNATTVKTMAMPAGYNCHQ